MLLRKKKITRELIRMLDGWRRSGFNVFAGERIQPREKKSLEDLAAYLIRATFSQERMEYSPEQAAVVYRSKDGKDKKTYDALEWLAAMACHVPESKKQTIRHYGACANSVRGRQRHVPNRPPHFSPPPQDRTISWMFWFLTRNHLTCYSPTV